MKLFYAGLLSLAMSSAALAGGLNEPVMEPTVSVDTIAADTAASGSHDIIVPLTALILIGAALAR